MGLEFPKSVEVAAKVAAVFSAERHLGRTATRWLYVKETSDVETPYGESQRCMVGG